MSQGKRKPNILPRPKTQVKTAIDGKTIPIKRVVPDDVPLQYADGLMIQQKEGMFILSFFQTQHPLVITKQEAMEVKHIEQRVIARMVISPTQWAKAVNIINKNFNGFLEKQSEETKEKLKKASNLILESGVEIISGDEDDEGD